jgi:hypothetical protein
MFLIYFLNNSCQERQEKERKRTINKNKTQADTSANLLANTRLLGIQYGDRCGRNCSKCCLNKNI